MPLEYFKKMGKASFLLGGQWGSEGKGAAAAYTAQECPGFDIVTTNAGAQAGHTSTHDGVTKVVFHLPTYSLYRPVFTYLNAGSIIDLDGLIKELEDNPQIIKNGFAIHPNAAIITPACREAEMRTDSAQTKIASTRKGVGEALSRKVLRSGLLAKDLTDPAGFLTEAHPIRRLMPFVRRVDLNDAMMRGQSVLVEVPQGHSLSIDGPFYPHTTSRNCTVMQAMSDAGIHPHLYYTSMLVVRTFPIRVGNINRPVEDGGDGTIPNAARAVPSAPGRLYEELGHSGGCFPDQHEITWEELGVKPEITTVTKRVRRVFTLSEQQVAEALVATRPSVIFLSFCDYVPTIGLVQLMGQRLKELSKKHGLRNNCPEILYGWGPSTADVTAGVP